MDGLTTVSRPNATGQLSPARGLHLRSRLPLALVFPVALFALLISSVGVAWAATPTAVTIQTDKTRAGYLARYSPNMTGMVSPSPALVGKLMHVNVKKPGKGYWTYSSNRVIYNSRGQAMWQYRYIFKSGMTKGIYYYQALITANATYAGSSSGIIAIGLNATPAAPSDRTAPTTTSDAVASYTGSAVINLTATDSGSGVAQTYYRLDGGAQAEGRQVVVNTEGTHTLQFWSVDKLTHKEAAKSVSFTITPAAGGDTTPPTTSSNAVSSYTGSANITLTALDNTGGSGVAHTYYKLDGAAQIEGTAISVSAAGPHSAEFWSVDVAGNTETPKTANFTITPVSTGDTTPPTTSSDAKSTYTGPAAIHLTATDNVGGTGVAATYFIIDGAAQVSGVDLNVVGVRSHTVEFWSVDVAGNVETPHQSVTFTVASSDITPPTTISDAQSTYTGNAVIQLTATDNTGGSGIARTYYRLDGAAQVQGTSISVSSLGSHGLEFWSVDLAGNEETPHKTANFSIAAGADLIKPKTVAYLDSFYFGSAHITFSATDQGGSGVAHTYYKLDGGAQTEGTSLVVTSVGSHSVEYWSVDGASNTETSHTGTFSVVADSEVQRLYVQTNGAFSPNPIYAVAGKPIQVNFTKDDGSGCFAVITFNDGASVDVGSAPGSIEFLSLDPGIYPYHCNMFMFYGQLIVE